MHVRDNVTVNAHPSRVIQVEFSLNIGNGDIRDHIGPTIAGARTSIGRTSAALQITRDLIDKDSEAKGNPDCLGTQCW